MQLLPKKVLFSLKESSAFFCSLGGDMKFNMLKIEFNI